MYYKKVENIWTMALPNWAWTTSQPDSLIFLKQVIEGKMKGVMEVTRRQGRRRKKLLDDLKDRRGYCHLKEEAVDRNMWRDRLGRGFEPVVRQTTGWWWWRRWFYIYIYIYTHTNIYIYSYERCNRIGNYYKMQTFIIGTTPYIGISPPLLLSWGRSL